MTLQQRLSALIGAIGADIKSLFSKQGNLANLTTTAKTDLVSAVNEVHQTAQTSTALIDDAQTVVGKTWSSSKIDSEVQAAKASANSYTDNAVAATKAAILGGASAAFDTLVELEQAVVANNGGVGALATAIGDRVSYTQNDNKTAAEQLQACINIGVGDPNTDFVAAYITAKQ